MKRKHSHFLETDNPPVKKTNIHSSCNVPESDPDDCFDEDPNLPSTSKSSNPSPRSPTKISQSTYSEACSQSAVPVKKQLPITSAFKKINAYAGNFFQYFPLLKILKNHY